MALYFGNNKVSINLNGNKYILNLCDITRSNVLLSSSGYILKDINGTYLIPAINDILLSSDNFMLIDAESVFLNTKEEA